MGLGSCGNQTKCFYCETSQSLKVLQEGHVEGCDLDLVPLSHRQLKDRDFLVVCLGLWQYLVGT